MERFRTLAALAVVLFAAAPSRADDLSLARRLSSEKEFAAAADVYERLVAAHPADVLILKEAARVAGWAGRYPRSIALYRSVLERYPKDLDARFGYGLVLSWAGDAEGALAAFDAVLAVDGGYVDARAAKARVLGWAGRHREARGVWKALLADDPGNDAHRRGLLDLYRWSGQADAGADLARRMLEDTPEDAELLMHLGRFERERGNTDAALGALREALRLAPDKSHLHAEIGQLEARDLRLDDAVTSLRASLASGSGDIDAWVALGRVLGYQDKVEESMAAYRRALETDPDNVDALTAAARTLRAARRYPEAREYLARARAAAPEDPGVRAEQRALRALTRPVTTTRVRFNDAEDGNLPGQLQSQPTRDMLVEQELSLPLAPERSLEFYAAAGQTRQRDRASADALDFIVDRAVFGAGARWTLPRRWQVFGRFDVSRHQEHTVDGALRLAPAAMGSGFAAVRWSPASARLTAVHARELFLASNRAAGEVHVDGFDSSSLAADWDVSDHLSLFGRGAWERASARAGRSEWEARARWRASWRGGWLFDARFLHRSHPAESDYAAAVRYKNGVRRLRYEFGWTPSVNTRLAPWGHTLSLFASIPLGERLEATADGAWAHHVDGFRGKTWKALAALRWSL